MSDTEDLVPEVDNLSLSDDNEKKTKVIDGRTYNDEEDVDYILPNDDDEADRLNFQHKALKYALGGLYKSPIAEKLEEGIQVIDAGCGPATWTLEMGNTYPNSKFTGIDISFVDSNIERPDNVNIQNGNITKDIPFEDNSIDFYHQRLLVAGLNEVDYKEALKNAYRVLKPGGYIELSEPNGERLGNEGPIQAQYNAIFNGMMKKRGLIPDMGEHIEDYLKELGFENVHFERVDLPINHGGKVGELMMKNNTEASMSLKPLMTMVNPAYEDDHAYAEYIQSIAAENAEYKTVLHFCIAYGQKPLE
ncbi:S-adenosyl-L-methionine-dependent methyltransferase [Pilobolus umbonatus]|nr:S-adenosyl-L-methionine-dependent methyltransferase [Pilobolus umbonatus]